MPTVSIGDAQLEYSVRGSGEPLLLVHGGVVADAYEPLLDNSALVSQYRVITYHRRGFGGSSGVDSARSIAGEASDAVALLDHLGIERAHVVGHSLAGLIVLQMAIQASDRVATLGLFEPAYMAVPSGATFGQGVGSIAEKFQSGDAAGALGDFLIAVGGDDAMSRLGLLSEESNQQALDDLGTLFASDIPALGGFNFTEEDARNISQTALSVLGTDSPPLFGEAVELLGSWLPKVTAVTIEGSSHFLQMEKPAEIGAELMRFLAYHPLATT